jgi:hypothetical protein
MLTLLTALRIAVPVGLLLALGAWMENRGAMHS